MKQPISAAGGGDLGYGWHGWTECAGTKYYQDQRSCVQWPPHKECHSHSESRCSLQLHPDSMLQEGLGKHHQDWHMWIRAVANHRVTPASARYLMQSSILQSCYLALRVAFTWWQVAISQLNFSPLTCLIFSGEEWANRPFGGLISSHSKVDI